MIKLNANVQNGLKQRTISGLFWKLLERGGSAVIQLLVQIVMARLLAPEEFGALAIMLVLVNIGNVVVQSGLNTALIQTPEIHERDYSTVFWMSFVVSIVLYVLIAVLAPAIGGFYGMPTIEWPIRALSLILIINALNAVQVAKVTRDLEMKKIFNATVVSVCVSAIAGIGSAFLGAGIWALVLQQLSFQLVNCLVMHFQVDWQPALVFDIQRAKELLSFGSKLLVSGLMNVIYSNLGSLIIGKQFSTGQLGLVSQGEKYPNAIGQMLDGAIQPVMLSAVSQVQDDVSSVKRLVRRALKTSTYLVFPAMTLFACLAPNLVPALLGRQWSGCVPFMQIYCFVYAILPIHTANLQALNGMGRSDVFMKLEIVKIGYGLIALCLCAFVFKDIRLLVMSYLVTGIISTVVNAWPNRKIIGYSYLEQVKDVAPALLISFLSAGAALIPTLWIAGSMMLVFLQATIFIVVYLGLSAAVGLEAYKYIKNTIIDVFRISK